jgi:hypothetical protein
VSINAVNYPVQNRLDGNTDRYSEESYEFHYWDTAVVQSLRTTLQTTNRTRAMSSPISQIGGSPPPAAAAVSRGVAGARNLPFHGTTTRVTMGMAGTIPTKVELSRDGLPPFAEWPSGTFFTWPADGQSLTGTGASQVRGWGNVVGPHVLNVVATYATGATATAAVTLNVAD